MKKTSSFVPHFHNNRIDRDVYATLGSFSAGGAAAADDSSLGVVVASLSSNFRFAVPVSSFFGLLVECFRLSKLKMNRYFIILNYY